MTELKCPFCQQELRSVIQQEGENTHTTWHCPKCELEKYKWACGNKTLWQALIDTRKALDVAKNAINSVVDHNIINCVAHGIDPRTDDINVTLCNALEQIIALEQKDVK